MQTPFLAALTKLLLCVSFLGPEYSGSGVSFGHREIGGVANTIQFPPISPNGLGNFTPSEYGQKHIAIPIPSVSVGAI